MYTIEMPREELKIPPAVTVGNRTRHSTATAVAFITDKLLLSAAFNSKKIYLIELTEDGHNILQTVNTRHHPDLMAYRDGMIVTSDYPHGEPNGHASIYDFKDGKIVFRKEIPIKDTKAHGCTIIDQNNIIITSNSKHNRGNLFINIESEQIKKNFNKFYYYPKDAFILGNKLFTVTSESLPQIGMTTVVKNSVLYMHDLNTLDKLDDFTFHGQTDSLVVVGEDGFIVVQGDDTLVHFNVNGNKVKFVKRIGGFFFPHGISTIGNKIAVTNYGDNTIRIFTLDELVNATPSSLKQTL
jgi:hypothetical protein